MADDKRANTLAPETHNDEQDDERMQAQTLADQAQDESTRSPTESTKVGDSGLMNDSTQDVVDHMRDMESSGRVDMDAYRGEPNHDDNEDKYGRANKVDPELPADGSGEKSQAPRA